VASEPLTRWALTGEGGIRWRAAEDGPWVLHRDVHAALTAVTAERDRLKALVERQGTTNEWLGARVRELRAALSRIAATCACDGASRAKAALQADDVPPPGHAHPRPCSICRREDCTVIHACE
jgi:hypothetical protein